MYIIMYILFIPSIHTSNASKASDILGTFLWAVSDDLQSGTKTLVIIRQPL